MLNCNGINDGMRHSACPDATRGMTERNARVVVTQRINLVIGRNPLESIITNTIPHTYTYKGRVGW